VRSSGKEVSLFFDVFVDRSSDAPVGRDAAQPEHRVSNSETMERLVKFRG